VSSTSVRDEKYGSLRAAWSGLEPLWLVFWVYGAIGSNLIGYTFEKVADAVSPYVGLLLILPVMGYYVWVNVSIWRCAANSGPLWCFLARATVVIAAAMIPWWIWSGIHEST
jgi:hypothetical protein